MHNDMHNVMCNDMHNVMHNGANEGQLQAAYFIRVNHRLKKIKNQTKIN